MRVLRPLLLVFCLMSLNGCTGLLIYELISSGSIITDSHEETPIVNVKYYYGDKPKVKKHDKSNMYPPSKSEFKPKKRSNNNAN